jgi:hypothetical protein
MRKLALSFTALFFMFLIGLDAVRAGNSSTTLRAAKSAAPSAPQVTCGITMQHWCIIAGDGIVNMLDNGNYRTWTIAPSGFKRPSVIVREDNRCDSPDGFHLKKIRETDYVEAGERRHAVTLSLTGEDTCTVRVEYPSGTDDRAREAQRMAKYWLYACAEASCRIPLLGVH